MTNAEIKKRTIELYDQLPQEEEARKARTDIRDKVIELNYSFFGYVATHKFINNTMVTYEDKLQSALCAFCTCWWWYRWEGHYRTDLSFAVFYNLRIGEMMERELNEVKYSIRRSLCMEAAAQLGKHWGKLTYEDLAHVNLPVDKMSSLKAMFGTLAIIDVEDTLQYMEAPKVSIYSDSIYSDNYDTIEELLIHEMIDRESKLSDKDLREMADIYQIDFVTLRSKRDIAEKMLYKKLTDIIDLRESY